jgi:ABC-type antimicrobial peptide transport system permease subunit
VIDSNLATRRFQVEVLGLFALLALALCAVGIYGVVGYAVSRRTFEIGVRMALGADLADVRRMVVRDALRPVAAGLGVGVAGALALTRVLRAELFGIQPHDPATFMAVVLTLLVVALVAAYLPARRASRVDPVVALRAE